MEMNEIKHGHKYKCYLRKYSDLKFTSCEKYANHDQYNIQKQFKFVDIDIVFFLSPINLHIRTHRSMSDSNSSGTCYHI